MTRLTFITIFLVLYTFLIIDASAQPPPPSPPPAAGPIPNSGTPGTQYSGTSTPQTSPTTYSGQGQPSYSSSSTPASSSSGSSDDSDSSSTPQPFTPYNKYKLIHWNHGPDLPYGAESSAGCINCHTSLNFSNPEAEKYKVGMVIPGLPFLTKNSWSGNIPIKGPGVRNATLFFSLWGKDDVKPGNDTIIWLNGGPSCSSLIGLVQEIGPFNNLDVRVRPTVNDYSWTKVANLLFVEHPVGVGFTTGEDLDTTEIQVAIQFESFLINFFRIFAEMRKTNIWFAAESYGGVYMSYIMDHLYRTGKYPQLKGGMMIDAVIPPKSLMQPVAYQYSVQHQKQLNFTKQDLIDIKNEADACNLTHYVEENLKYPSKGDLDDVSDDCAPWSLMIHFARERNENFTPYNVEKRYADDYNPLGEVNTGTAVYHHQNFFDNPDLQKYIHAPNKKWVLCTDTFYRGDESDYPIYYPNPDHSILANVIEKSERFIIMNGVLDALIIANATAMALQNLTWNHKQGFSKPPFTPLWDINGNQTGILSHERGLTFAIASKAGHAIPQDDPPTGFAAAMHLTGQFDWTKNPNLKSKAQAKTKHKRRGSIY